jgi:hypothetical protein
MEGERNRLKAMTNVHVEAMADLVDSLAYYTNAGDGEAGMILAWKIRSHAEKYLSGASTGFVASSVEFREEE